MKVTKIVSDNKWFNNFYCRNCKYGTNVIYKVEGRDLTFCDKCLSKDIKKSDIKSINQNRDLI